MKTLVLALLVSSPTLAQAGSSATILACSSVSGKTIISGFLPGQGEMEIRLHVSVGSAMSVFSNEGGSDETTEATIDLNARAQTVAIKLKGPQQTLQIVSKSPETTKLGHGRSGTKGTFLGLVTGTHPATWEPIPSAIEVRCHVSDEI
jgi:hypothetical protein